MLDIAAGLKQWRESQRKCKMDDGLARSKETAVHLYSSQEN